ncbi:MAG TPA: MIP/aquaporin family protein [Burkholderiales bacterium]|nr:MIP/aquaporin family protein [Burkholderiales bacterium]
MAEPDMMVPAGDYNADGFLDEGLLNEWIRPLISEAIGPFALVFIGAGSILLAATQGYGNGGTLVMVALAHGLAIGLMVAATGHISGGHFNPAITIGLFLGGKIGLLKSIGYIAAQLIGAVIAALILKQLFDDSVANFKSAVPAVNYAGDQDGIIFGRQNALIMEIILTFFLVYVVIGTAVDSRGPHAIASLAIGLSITMDILVGGPLTGAAMNPARHFGPALVDGEWKDTWIYWVGPIIGGAIASIVQIYILIPRGVGFPDVEPQEHHP